MSTTTSTNKEIFEQNNPRQYTEAEIHAMSEVEKALSAANYDFWTTSGATKNANIILGYFNDIKHRNIPLTFKTAVEFVNANQGKFVVLSAAQNEYYKIRSENPAAADALNKWLATQGKAGQLENRGDAGFTNATALLRQLNGRSDINATTCFNAQQQLVNRPDGGKLVWIPAEKAPSPYQHAETKGNDRVNWTAVDYKREAKAREEAEAKSKQPTVAQQLGQQDQFYKFTIERHLEFGNHAENEAIRSLHKRLVSDGASLKTQYETLAKEVDYYTKRAQVISRSLR